MIPANSLVIQGYSSQSLGSKSYTPGTAFSFGDADTISPQGYYEWTAVINVTGRSTLKVNSTGHTACNIFGIGKNGAGVVYYANAQGLYDQKNISNYDYLVWAKLALYQDQVNYNVTIT